MGKQKYKKLVQAILATGTAFIVNFLIQMLLTPYITQTVGTESYGFVGLAKNFAQYAMIVTMAVNSFAARFIAVEYHSGNMHKANVLFSSAFYGDGMLATLLFTAGAVIIIFLERILQISPEIMTDVKLLFLFVFLNFWLINVFTVFETAGYIENRLDIAGVFKGVSYLVEAAVLCVMYFCLPARVFYVGIGLLCASVITAAGNIWITRKYTPQLRIKRKDFSWKAIKDLIGNGIWTSVNALGEVLNNGLDLIVCNLMLTPLAMGQVAIAKTVHSMMSGVFVILNPAFQPMMLRSYAQNDKKTLLSELRLSMKVSGMAANILFAGFVVLGQCFYRLWIPNENIDLIYTLTVINLLTLIPGGPMQPLYYIYVLTLKRKIPCLVTIAGGVCNVIGMVVLIRYTELGVTAVVWTTAVVMMVINLISNPLYMAHVLNIPKHSFYPDILRNLVSCGVITGVCYALFKLYLPNSWITLVICAVIVSAIGVILHLMIVCSREDLKRIWRFIKREKMENGL